jgi:hypothetical protein
MLYTVQPKLQISSGLIAAATAAGIAWLIEGHVGQVDWVTILGVAVGVAIGMGFAPIQRMDRPVAQWHMHPQWPLGFLGFFSVRGAVGAAAGDWLEAIWLVWVVWFWYFIPRERTDVHAEEQQ